MAATLLAYLPALRGGFIWDDDEHISSNRLLHTAHGLWQIWFNPGSTPQYYPVTFTVFWLEYHLWALQTLGYHLVNVILHGTAAVLLWQVLTRLKVRGAWLAGAIFALHPVCVMSVAWITELKNTLSATLALAAAWAYLRAAKLGTYEGGKNADKLDWRYYALALGLFQLAMFAKTAISFLPVSLLLVSWWCGRRMNWRTVWPVLPMIGIGVAMGLLTVQVEQSDKGGASGAAFHLSLVERILVSGRSFWFYLGKLAYPDQLTFIYPRWTVDPKAWWQYVYPAAMMALLGGLWLLRKRLGKGLLVALLHFFTATSLLILLVVPYFTQFSFVSDHWQYFGCMSAIALAAAGIVRMLGVVSKSWAPLEPILCGVLLLTLGSLTWQQTGIYHDNEKLMRDILAHDPNSWMAHDNLGALLCNEGRFDEGVAQLHEAIALHPNNACAYSNLGQDRPRQGHLDEAIQDFTKSLEIMPNYLLGHYNLGRTLARLDKLDEAIPHLRRAVQIDGEFPLAHFALGQALEQKGDQQGAIEQYTITTELSPAFPAAQAGLADVLAATGKTDDAIIHYRKALELDPNSVETLANLGIAFAKKNRLDDAVAAWRAALRVQPDIAGLHYNIATVLEHEGKHDEAQAEIAAAKRIGAAGSSSQPAAGVP